LTCDSFATALRSRCGRVVCSLDVCVCVCLCLCVCCCVLDGWDWLCGCVVGWVGIGCVFVDVGVVGWAVGVVAQPASVDIKMALGYLVACPHIHLLIPAPIHPPDPPRPTHLHAFLEAHLDDAVRADGVEEGPRLTLPVCQHLQILLVCLASSGCGVLSGWCGVVCGCGWCGVVCLVGWDTHALCPCTLPTNQPTNQPTHTHTHIYIYIYIYNKEPIVTAPGRRGWRGCASRRPLSRCAPPRA
jgi:hypothetical protein